MITITSDTHQEKIKIAEEEIVLNGPPSNLQGHIKFMNHENDMLRVKTLALENDTKEQKINSKDFLRLSFRLHPGEHKLQSISHELPSTTPPGTYENYLMLGDKRHKVKMIVQPTIEIQIYPEEFTFQGTAPCTEHLAVLNFTNLGNVPFQIPNLKHAAALDMDLLCRAFGQGFRENDKGDLMATLDDVTKNLKRNLPDWVIISIDEFEEIVQPGESQLLHVHFTMPENSEAKRDYDGTFRFWDKEISVRIKSHTI